MLYAFGPYPPRRERDTHLRLPWDMVAAMFVDPAADDDATALYAEVEAQLGHVPNYARAFGRHPGVYRAWAGLNGAIKASLEPRLYELATVAAARRLRSSYCSLAHGKVLAEQLLDAEQVRRIAADPLSAGLEPLEAAVVALAEKVVDDATSVTAADLDELRALGLDDAAVEAVVLAAAARCFFSKTLDALGVLPDSSYASLDPALRDALTVGRPIASAE
jgi:uncharacterized peroxidase-related enzyme